MTDKTYPYDPEFPIVTVNALGFGFARFTCMNQARHYAPECTPVDTTPKPRVPDDAKWITYLNEYGTHLYARRLDSGAWEDHDGDARFLEVEDLPGVTPETVFTVLEERKS